MKIDLDKLSAEERQSFANDLHQAAVYPTRLVGIGTPAHVEAINANLSDLRSMVAMQTANIQKFYELVSGQSRVAAAAKTGASNDNNKDDQ